MGRQQLGRQQVGRQRITLADVASRAGVSASTASLAFSGGGPVAESTRARVLAAAAELGYAGPDPLARSLRQRRSGVVGVVIGSRLRNAFRDPVATGLLDGLSEQLSGLGSGLLLLPGPGPESKPAPAADPLARVPVDVLVFATCGADDDPLIEEAIARGIPILGVEGPHRPGVPLVDIEQHAGARSAASYLADLGHREVAVVTLPLRADGRSGPVDASRLARATFAVSRARLAGVREVFDLPPSRIQEAGSNLVDEGERIGADLLAGSQAGSLAGRQRPTAVLTQSDLLAIGVLRAADRAGLRVPEDLSVAGFDGIDASEWLPTRRLTTVEQPVARKGQIAGQMVAELLAGRTPASVTLPVRLRPGATTGPAPHQGPPAAAATPGR